MQRIARLSSVVAAQSTERPAPTPAPMGRYLAAAVAAGTPVRSGRSRHWPSASVGDRVRTVRWWNPPFPAPCRDRRIVRAGSPDRYGYAHVIVVRWVTTRFPAPALDRVTDGRAAVTGCPSLTRLSGRRPRSAVHARTGLPRLRQRRRRNTSRPDPVTRRSEGSQPDATDGPSLLPASTAIFRLPSGWRW
jgi:hypothetical protein